MTKELTAKDIKKLSQQELFPPHPEAGDLLVACHRGHYSASAIARVVALRVNRRDLASVARSLARYGYDVLDFDSPADPETIEEARLRAAEILRYLEL